MGGVIMTMAGPEPGAAETGRSGGNCGSASSQPPFRKTRWFAALLIVVLAAILTITGLIKGTRPDCQVTTVTHTGAPGGTTTTKACGMIDVTDYIYFLAVVGVLLLPDIKSLKIGGLEFERLTTEVNKQSSEIGQLRQQISNVVQNTNAISVQVGDLRKLAFGDFRDYFLNKMEVLRRLRQLLPPGEQTEADLARVDDIERRIDMRDLNPVEIFDGLRIVEQLVARIVVVTGIGKDQLPESQQASDALEGSQQASAVLQDFFSGDPAES
jgi:hypothetical protein